MLGCFSRQRVRSPTHGEVCAAEWAAQLAVRMADASRYGEAPRRARGPVGTTGPRPSSRGMGCAARRRHLKNLTQDFEVPPPKSARHMTQVLRHTGQVLARHIHVSRQNTPLSLFSLSQTPLSPTTSLSLSNIHDPSFAHALHACWLAGRRDTWGVFWRDTWVMFCSRLAVARCRHARGCALQPATPACAATWRPPLSQALCLATATQQPTTSRHRRQVVHSCRPRRTAEGQAPERCGGAGAGAAARRETGPLTAPEAPSGRRT